MHALPRLQIITFLSLANKDVKYFYEFFWKLLLLFFFPSFVFAVGDISGTVRDNESMPISGATVEIYKNQILIDSTTTLGDGTYSLTSLSSGSYDLVASADFFQTSVQGVNVKNNQTIVADFTLFPDPGSISGTVKDATTMLAISGATITVLQNDIIIATAMTNGSGVYTISGIAPGSYVITASALTYQTAIAAAAVSSDVTTTVNFSLESNPGTLSGIVKSESSGLPIEGATVEINLNNVVITSTQTAVDGSYSISGVAPGSYIIHAHAEDYQTGANAAIITPGGSTSVDFFLVS